MAIQAATPDPQDLASDNALQILCPALNDSTFCTEGNGLPDDACGLAQPEISSLMCEFVHSSQAGSTLNKPCVPMSGSDAIRLASAGRRIERLDSLIEFLNRLIC